MIYVGIDIGKNGAIVVNKGKTIMSYPMPLQGTEVDYHFLYDILKNIRDNNKDVWVLFEKLGVIFGTSKATAFSMGYQSGVLEAYCIALNLPYTMVSAKVWQKNMFTGVSEILKPNKKRDTKAMAAIAASRMISRDKLKFSDKSTKLHDGLVDAYLISEYGKRGINLP